MRVSLVEADGCSSVENRDLRLWGVEGIGGSSWPWFLECFEDSVAVCNVNLDKVHISRATFLKILADRHADVEHSDLVGVLTAL